MFHSGGGKTARRFEIYRGLITLLGADLWHDQTVDQRRLAREEALRALLARATSSMTPLAQETPAGLALGRLDATTARRFSEAVDQLIAGQLAGAIDPEHGYFLLVDPPANAAASAA